MQQLSCKVAAGANAFLPQKRISDPKPMGVLLGKPLQPAVVWFDEFVNALPSMAGKNVAITGTTSGTGFHAAGAMLRKGATVYLLNRPSERSRDSLQRLQDLTSREGQVTQVDCDLQSFASVKAAASKLRSLLAGDGLDVLANNAGIMAMPDVATEDGFNQEIQTNHLSHFLLTSELMPALRDAVQRRGGARIVNHSSTARLFARRIEPKYFGQRGGELGGNSLLVRQERYAQTKLANAVFTHALQDRLTGQCAGIMCLVCAPGACKTNLATRTSATLTMGGIVNAMAAPLLQSGADGSMPLLHCMASPGVASGQLVVPQHRGVVGWLLGDGIYGPPQIRDLEKHCRDDAACAALWQASQAAVGSFAADCLSST